MLDQSNQSKLAELQFHSLLNIRQKDVESHLCFARDKLMYVNNGVIKVCGQTRASELGEVFREYAPEQSLRTGDEHLKLICYNEATDKFILRTGASANKI